MRGLLADVNVQLHAFIAHRLLENLGILPFLVEKNLEFASLRDAGLATDVDDRTLWTYCQREGWVLFTENRNDDGPDSLQATLDDSWTEGCLPILTLSKKARFERDRTYAQRVAADVAELLFGIAEQQYRDRPRIYVPLSRG